MLEEKLSLNRLMVSEASQQFTIISKPLMYGDKPLAVTKRTISQTSSQDDIYRWGSWSNYETEWESSLIWEALDIKPLLLYNEKELVKFG